MKRLRFYKNEYDEWYVDLPMWTGSQAALEMVEGADTLLEHLSCGKDYVILRVSEDEFENADVLTLIKKPCLRGGAYYKIDNKNLNLEIWLCDVTKFVLGDFPNEIYFVKVR